MVDTPHSEHFDDIYFAVEDGLTESTYIFLHHNNLPEAWQGKDRFVICETGFGTGLNFLCAWKAFEESTKPNQKLHYYSFEKFPLSPAEIVQYLGHWSGEFNGRLEQLFQNYPLRIGGWHNIHFSKQVTLTLIFDDVNRAIPEMKTPVDCWFLDGHAPSKNPDMWTDNLFQNMGRLSKTGTRFATFTAAGFVRRGLAAAGFTVTKDKAFGAKNDMTKGIFEGEKPITQNPPSAQNIAIIGGGIAGAALAYSLKNRQADVTIFERNGIATGGSGNQKGLCNPRITASRGPEADFYSPAFQLANKLFADISKEHDIGFTTCGSIHMMNDANKEKRFTDFVKNWDWHNDHARLLTPAGASGIAGVPLQHTGLYLPEASAVCPKKATEYLAQFATHITIQNIPRIEQSGTGWVVNDQYFDAVILAGGYDVTAISYASQLPLQKIRGQVTRVQATPFYKNLKTNLCYGGYASVADGDEAIIGSTFQPWLEDENLRAEDDAENLGTLADCCPDLAKDLTVTGGRAAFRCSAKDRSPVIGQLRSGDHLYISTAHSSHGIISSLMGAEFIAAKICHEPQILPHSVERFLSPSRFKIIGY